MSTTQTIQITKAVASQPLIDGFPGGQLLDFAAFPSSSGPATAGVYRNLGNVPQFDVAGYPEDEFKYVIDGEMAVVQGGKEMVALAGDLVYIPKGAAFTVLPTVFTAVFFSARAPAFTKAPRFSAQL
ncbi:hypothetical protein JCM3775_001366 [Rhodotorula graminis]|uniref:(S)-ureidoglycine aminohydrolase cupin domain-containing protein n=1 Tax=Rhodotorula graminis (strain WP1) TaxID=578459 RepID=A0A194S1A8_RHOGW|nr:uncharacterized protein RHOBADRAFT_44873 [Rhodotorula graminis WP1]KPV74382.1 hypothetical protein RHOBADRAFT_44873 [Rhodotorula graminis WP1]